MAAVVPVAVGLLSVELGALLGIGILVVWVCGLVDLMTKRPDLDGRHRAAWILIIVLFPIVGTLVYFFIRPTLPREREQMIAARQASEAIPERFDQAPRRT